MSNEPPDKATRPAATRAGAYELLLELASGGMATVHLARAVDGRDKSSLVALKRPHRHLATDKMFLSMLLDEARLASAIDHPNVVRVRELGFEAGEPFIVMDYVEGASLSELRKELVSAERAVDTKVAVRVILDALAGLHAAHELKDDTGKPLGIIHRDISPHNVLIGCDGRVRLTDFGIAHAEDRVQTTRTHEVKGKLAYLAPERIDRRRICTKQSDLFSMAVVLWECLAGRRLFRGEEALDTLQEVMSAPIPRLRQLGAQIPPGLDDAIARGLSRDLTSRYETASEFAAAIEKGAGRANVGTATDVERVMETVFGPRMGLRHEALRGSLPADELEALFTNSGLAPRPPPPDMALSNTLLFATIAPPAPSERYAFGNLNDPFPIAPRKKPWPLIAGIAGGVAFGALSVFFFVARASTSEPLPVPPPVATLQPAPLLRRVVVPLPFVATHVEFDDAQRDLDPASDVSAFEVPSESGLDHRVVAIAVDGSRAEGMMREVQGVARPDADGFMIAHPRVALPTRSGGVTSRPPRLPPPVGTKKNGFTKLQ
ncbi:MAG: serine/threonine-protein kinase [Polyangiaceae bacterium]